jgi:hypothetical protein
MTRSRFVTKAVDTGDSSLEGTAQILQAALEEMVADNPLITVQVFPMRASYSTPDPDSMMRDFHYTDVGFILVGSNPPCEIDK